jgi:hypothetical protein
MSDFGELCPLFNTGVFSEITFPYVRLSDTTLCGNYLFASVAAMASGSGYFTFGRTVIVTGAYLRKQTLGESNVLVVLQHHTSLNAVGTVFATLAVSVTVTGHTPYYAWLPMNVTAATFTSTDVLGMAAASVVVSAGIMDLIVRYKEK